MKKYVTRFIVSLMVCTIFVSGFINEEYKLLADENNVEIENLEQFIDDFSVISEEIKDAYYEDFEILDIKLSPELQLYTFDMCKKYSENYSLVRAIMATESNFKEDAKCQNKTDSFYSRGYMQLNERFIEEFKELTGIEDFDIMNPYHNIEAGVAKIHNLRELWSEYDISDEDMFLAITNSYNLGFEKFKKAVTKKGFYSREYDRKVLKNKIKLEQDGGIE